VPNRRTRNNSNCNNQSVATEEVLAEKLTLEQVVALYQERCATTSRRRSQSVGNNDKQRFRITEECVYDRQTTSGMYCRREHVAQMC
jgi:hypothetical protein